MFQNFLNRVLLRKLQDSPIKFATLTKGVNLKGKVAEIFAYYGTWIRISLEGWDDDSYAEYRNIKSGEFTKLLKNVSKFTSLNGKCHIGASIIVDKKNVYYIYELAMKLKDKFLSMPDRVAPIIAANSDQYEIRKILKDEIHDAILEFIENGGFLDE